MRRWIRSWAAVLAVVSAACQGSDAGKTVVFEAGAGPTIDYEGVTRFMSERATIPTGLQRDFDRVGSKGIPVDIVFEQGVHLLGNGR
jgi:hypothetical protein